MSLSGLRRWLLVQALLWGPALIALPWTISAVSSRGGAAEGLPASWLFAVWGGAAGTSYVVLWFVLGAGRRVADFVTLLRFVGLLAVTFFIWRAGGPTWGLWAACVAVVCADLLDGYFARRFGGSDSGAVLDMETDQLTTLALAILLHAVCGVGAWVLLLPGFRYLYILFLLPMGMPVHDPKPRDGDNRRAKYICAAMMVLMLIALMPTVADATRSAVCGVAVLLLAWSYVSDVVFLVRRAPTG